MVSEAVLRVDGVHRAFSPAGGGPAVPVLRGVHLRLQAGELVTLAGPSGSGKSALLAIIAGFDRPDSGTVSFAGQTTSATGATSASRANSATGGKSANRATGAEDDEGADIAAAPPWSTVALVPQSLGLLDELTCEENAAAPLLFARAHAHARVEDLRTARALLDSLGVGDLARRYPGEVSLGQQQRVALARALIACPTVLLADEPTAHLDHRTIDAVVDVLTAAVGRGTACLLATHDEALTRRAHRRLGLRHGVLTDADLPDLAGNQ